LKIFKPTVSDSRHTKNLWTRRDVSRFKKVLIF
jgi:hypothetical protein